MITAVKDIGEILLEKEQKQPLDVLIENPDSNGIYKKVLVLNFSKFINFIDIDEEELKTDYRLYLYKKGSSNSPDYSPTSRITEPEKTFKRVLKWFEKHSEDRCFNKILKELKKNEDYIIKKLKNLSERTKEGKILTVKINGKYLYQIEKFKKVFLDDIFEKIKEVSKEDGICSLCGEKKDLVFSTSQIYQFYTTDKECYISSGFRKENSWKNFPVCTECFLKAIYGRKFIESHLKFKFYGKSYYLIPKLILNTKEAIEEINDILENSEKNIKLNKSTFTEDEKEILEILKDYQDIVSFYLLFLKGGSTADKDRILLLIEDVLPSRISKIFNAKKEVEDIFNADFTFGNLNIFLNDFDRLFFEVVDKIFKGGKLNFKTLLQIFNKKIRQDLNDNKNFIKTTKLALMDITFFEKLGLINREDLEMEDTQFEEVFKKVGKSLNTPAKKGIFLLGALVQMLLNLQTDNKPFFKQLKGLKMNEDDIKGLLPKTINKLQEYDKYDLGKQRLAKEISKYLLQEEKFNLTIDEINFYFVAGMTLSDEIKNILYNKGGNENESNN